MEGIAYEIGVLDDLIALIEVTEDKETVAHGVFYGANAEIEFSFGGLTVLAWQDSLGGRTGGQGVAHGGARAVTGCLVEEPWRIGQGRGADLRGGAFGPSWLFADANQLDRFINRSQFISLRPGNLSGVPKDGLAGDPCKKATLIGYRSTGKVAWKREALECRSLTKPLDYDVIGERISKQSMASKGAGR